MRKEFYGVIIFLLTVFMAGCNSLKTPSVPAAPSPTGTLTATITCTPTPAQSFTQSMTPTITLTATLMPTPVPLITVFVSISFSTLEDAAGVKTEDNRYGIELSDRGTPMVDATVIINSTPVPYTGTNAFFGRADFESYDPVYVPNGLYTIEVFYHSLTLTGSMNAPGPITVAPDGSGIDWTYGGVFNSITVELGSTDLLLPTNNVTSPFAIDPGIYSTPGDYRIFCGISNITFNLFSAPYMVNSYGGCGQSYVKMLTKP